MSAVAPMQYHWTTSSFTFDGSAILTTINYSWWHFDKRWTEDDFMKAHVMVHGLFY